MASGSSRRPKVQAGTARLRLRLYVAGTAPNSLRAVENAESICKEHFASRCEIEVVDLLQHPRRALADGIIVTPTLLKVLPSPVQRIVGDLSDRNQVLLILGGQ